MLAEPVSLEDHALGRLDSSLTLVQYGDYECADTRRWWVRLRALQLQRAGRLLLVFRHFPLESIHPNAWLAAAAAEAASAQGEFWTMHNHLLDHQAALSPDDLRILARDLGLDSGRFERDRASAAVSARIDRDLMSGQRGGVRVTPTLFVNSIRHDGPRSLGSLRAALIAAGLARRRPGR
jgi:protein-disulfide isomerase